MNYNSYNIKVMYGVGASSTVRVDDCYLEVIEMTGALGLWRKEPNSDYEASRLEQCWAAGQWASFEIITE